MEITYPRLIRRVQAVLIDVVIFIIFMAISLYILHIAPDSHAIIKAILFIFPYLILEPILVSVTGGSIGHHFMGLRVRRVNVHKNLNFFIAVFRCAVKIFLGWLSLFFVLMTKKHQAIHDLISLSIVINKNEEQLPEYEKLKERVKDQNYYYPSIIRRIMVVLSYLISAFFIFVIIVALSISDECAYESKCTLFEGIFQTVISYGILIIMGFIIYQGWNGNLYGCKKTKIQNNT